MSCVNVECEKSRAEIKKNKKARELGVSSI